MARRVDADKVRADAVPAARERLARHLWIAEAGSGGARIWDGRAVDRTAWLDKADVILGVIAGEEG